MFTSHIVINYQTADFVNKFLLIFGTINPVLITEKLRQPLTTIYIQYVGTKCYCA